MTTEVIVSGFCNLVGFEFETEQDVKIFAMLYDQITHCFDKQQYLFQMTPSAKAAKECIKDYEYANSRLKFPVGM